MCSQTVVALQAPFCLLCAAILSHNTINRTPQDQRFYHLCPPTTDVSRIGLLPHHILDLSAVHRCCGLWTVAACRFQGLVRYWFFFEVDGSFNGSFRHFHGSAEASVEGSMDVSTGASEELHFLPRTFTQFHKLPLPLNPTHLHCQANGSFLGSCFH